MADQEPGAGAVVTREQAWTKYRAESEEFNKSGFTTRRDAFEAGFEAGRASCDAELERVRAELAEATRLNKFANDLLNMRAINAELAELRAHASVTDEQLAPLIERLRVLCSDRIISPMHCTAALETITSLEAALARGAK
jgi:hypothetical protein